MLASANSFALRLLEEGILTADCEKGLIYSQRWPHPLGCLNTAGYVVFTAHGFGQRMQLKAHRVIWLAAGNYIPAGRVLDHINGNKADNRVCNLRVADARLNAANRRSYVGAGNPASKLNDVCAERIRDLHSNGISYGKISAHMFVSKSLVAQIIRGEIW